MANLGGKSEASSITGSDLQAFRAIFSILISALRQGLLSHPRKETPQEKIIEILMDFGPFYSCTYCLEATKELNLLDVRLQTFPF